MAAMPGLGRLARYLWASPNTLLGLAAVPLALLGGRVQVVAGVVELHGPVIAWLLGRCVPLAGGACALTLGHVVLGRDRRSLERSRRHERVHVRQYECWGPLFLPAYFLSSLLAWRRGADPYRDNRFEREAYRGERRR
ncbi:MAG: hypothetical protein M3Z21_00275 [Pseudomonadota bacterium]|nr:hypothetical protein [Pseudomonadota bacterium]